MAQARWGRRTLVVAAILTAGAAVSLLFTNRTDTGKSAGARPRQTPTREKASIAEGQPFEVLLQHASSNPCETFRDIRVPQPKAYGQFDENGRRVAKPGEKLVAAKQRVILKDKNVEILETIVKQKKRDLRVLETIKYEGKSKQVVRRQRMAAHQIIVKLNSARRLPRGYQVLRKLGKNGATVLSFPTSLRLEQAVAELKQSGTVAYAEPDWLVSTALTPDDTNFGQLWGLHNTGQTGGTEDADIDAPEAWDITTGNSTVIVGVIDSGIDYTHPDLAPNMWVNVAEQNGEAGVDDDGNGYVDDIYGYNFQGNNGDPLDDNFHGTHCAGTIGAAGNNAQGVIGVCWNVKLMALKFLDAYGYGYTSDAVEAVNYGAANGVRILSNSWGGGGFSQAMRDAIAAAEAEGVLFVAASGNDGADNDASTYYPAGYDVATIVAVAATDHNDALASFSNYGATSVDLAAPGVSIYSTFPTYMTSDMTSLGFSTDYESISGTSMATPHVAGAAALILGNSPSLTVSQLRDRLLLRVAPKAHLAGRMATAGRLNVFNGVDPAWTPLPAQVVATGTIVDDTAGNGNGYVNAGETITLTPSLINIGQQDALEVVSTLTASDPFVTVTDSTESIGNMVPLVATTVANGFQIQLSPDTPDGHPINLSFTCVDQSGSETTSTLTIYATRDLPKAYQAVNFVVGQILADRQRDVVYIIDRSEYRVISVSTDTGNMLTTQYLGGGPNGGYMAQSLDGNLLYVAVQDANEIKVLSLPDLTLHSTFTCDFRPVSLAAGPNNRLYVTSSDYWGPVRQLDATTGAVLGTFNDGYDFYMNAMVKTSLDGTRLFLGETGLMTSGGPAHICEFDISTGAPPVLTKKHPYSQVYMADFAVDERHDRIYTMHGGIYAVQVTDMNTGSYGETWPLSDPYGKAVDFLPEANTIFAANGFVYNDFTVRRYLRTDGTPIADYQIIPGSNQGGGYKVMQARQMEITPNGNVLISQDNYGASYHIGILGIDNININPPSAKFTATPTLGSAPMTVALDASSSSVTEGSIVDYTWDFGDGSNGTGVTPSHTYATDSEYQVSLTVTDSRGFTSSTALTVISNTPPQAQPTSASTDEDTPVDVALTATDTNNDTLSFVIAAAPAHGTLSGSGPTYTYTPNKDFNGTDSFTYKVNDGHQDSNEAVVSLAINPINDAPVAALDSTFVRTGESVEIPVLDNDTDADGDQLSVTANTAPSSGSVSLDGNMFTYTPNAEFRGVDTFTYTISDGNNETAVGTVRIVVLGDSGTASAWPTMGANSAHTSYRPIAISSDGFAASWSAPVTTQHTLHQVSIGFELVFVSPGNIYMEEPYMVALDQRTGVEVWRRTFDNARTISPPTYADGFLYFQRGNHSSDSQLWCLGAASGETAWSSPYSVQWSQHYAPVVDGNDVFAQGGYYGGLNGYNKETGVQNFFIALQQYDQWCPAVADGKLYSWVEGIFAEHNRATGEKIWSLDLGWDWHGWSMNRTTAVHGGYAYAVGNPGLFAINLSTRSLVWSSTDSFTGSAAVANNVTYALIGSEIRAYDATTGQLQLTYVADEALQWQPIVTDNVLIAASANKTYVFDLGTATPRQTLPVGGLLSLGDDRLYVASGTGTLHTYTFALQNTPPAIDSAAWADPEAITLPETTTVGVTASDSDADDVLTYAWSKVSGSGTVTFAAPTADTSEATFSEAGTYVLRVTISDGNGGTVTSDVTVVINTAPAAVDDTATTPEETAVSIGVLANDTDADGDTLSILGVTQPTNGNAVINGTQVTYTPNNGFAGSDSFTYTISDGNGGTATATVYLTVIANLAPSVNAGPDQTVRLPSTANLDATVTDDGLPGAGLTTTWTRVSGPGTVTFADAAAVDTAATFSAAGVYVLRLTANDSKLSASDELTITVLEAFREPENPADTVAGINWERFLGNWNALPDFDSLTADATGTTGAFGLGLGEPADYFAYRFVGFIEVPSDGEYTFYTSSDDGSKLYIGNVEVVDNDGLHAVRERGGTIGLKAGKHAITATVFEKGGGESLIVRWSGPGLAKADVPASALYRISNGNEAPNVNAGLDQSIQLPTDSVSLDATVTDDGLPGVGLTVAWTKVSGPGTVTFADAAAVDTTATFGAVGVYVLRLTAGDGELSTDDDLTVTVLGALREPENPADTVAGVNWERFLGNWNALPDFDSLTADATGTTMTFGLGLGEPADYFAYRFTGYIEVPSDGEYTFYTSSDDGSKLYIGSVEVVDNDGLHGVVERSGTIGLKAGKHAITATVFEKGGGQSLIVRWSGPGIAKADVPTSALYRISNGNEAPVVNAGSDQSVSLPTDSISLDASATDDGLPGTGLTTAWTKISGPGTVTFADAGAIDTTATFGATGVYVLRLTANDSLLSASDDVTVRVLDPSQFREPENPADTVPGISWERYLGNWSVLPVFDTLTVDAAGTTGAFGLGLGEPADYFAYRFAGYIEVPSDGEYTFYTSSDDGSKLYIGNVEVVNNDGLHGVVERSGTIGLKAGKHAITATVFERTGGQSLVVRWSGPGVAKSDVPASALYRAP